MTKSQSRNLLSCIKAIVSPLFRLHPRGEDFARYVIFWFWRLKARIISRSRNFDANKTYWINPNSIEYALVASPGNKYDDIGKIIGGSWDTNLIRFVDLDIYKAFHDHFLDNAEWQSTAFYDRVLKEMQEGTVKWSCRTASEFDARLEGLDSLFEDIKQNGYKTQADLFEKDHPGLPSLESTDEIAVRISRHGDLLLQDGRHRLAIVKLLNLLQIPVKITARHSEWYRFRQEVLHYAKLHNNKVYHQLTHVDLRDIPAEYSDERFELIKPHLPKQKSNLLDLGANWGYFCHRFENEGFFHCHAIENNPGSVYFLNKLMRAECRQFEIIEESILGYRTNTGFDVVLALNIFHHFLKAEKTYYGLIDFLKHLNMKIMFFQPHLPHEEQMVGAYKNYACEEFVDFLLEHSRLTQSKLIGKAEYGRPIYMLHK